MIPRDSQTWFVVAFGAWLASLAANPAAVEQLFELDRHAWIAAVCQLLAITAGVMRASPIHAISEEGKRRYIAKAETAKFKARS